MQYAWDHRTLARIDWRMMPIIGSLMVISLLVISSMTAEPEESFWTPLVKSQLRWFLFGWGIFALTAAFDYRKLQSWSVILYAGVILLLLGLYFTAPIQNVHRWYRISSLGINVQPSEYAKLIVAIALAAFWDKEGARAQTLGSAFKAIAIAGIPFLLVLKQPDLGTALILFPISLAMGYFADMHRGTIKILSAIGIIALLVILSFFVGIFSHEEMRPWFTRVMKEYQYDRLNPNTYHQKAAVISIAVGGHDWSWLETRGVRREKMASGRTYGFGVCRLWGRIWICGACDFTVPFFRFDLF